MTGADRCADHRAGGPDDLRGIESNPNPWACPEKETEETYSAVAWWVGSRQCMDEDDAQGLAGAIKVPVPGKGDDIEITTPSYGYTLRKKGKHLLSGGGRR